MNISQYVILIAFMGIIFFVTHIISYNNIFYFTDPIARLYQISGWASIAALFLSLISPFPFKKYIGFLAFAFAATHIYIFFNLDFEWLWEAIFLEIQQKEYILYGTVAWVLFCIAMIFSFLDKFKKIYLIPYIILFFSSMHIVFIQKVLTPLHIFLILMAGFTIAFKIYLKIRYTKKL